MNLHKSKVLINILKRCGKGYYSSFIKISILKVSNTFLEMLGLAMLFSTLTVLLKANALDKYLEKINSFSTFNFNQNEFTILLLIALLLFFIIKNIISYQIESAGIRFIEKVIYTLNDKIVRGFYARGYWFLKGEKTFGFAQKSGGMSYEFGMQVLKSTWQLISDASLLLFFSALAAYTSFMFSALLLTLSLPLTFIINKKLKVKAKKVGEAKIKQVPKNSRNLFDLFTGYIEMRVYGSTEQFISKYLSSVKKLTALKTAQTKLNLFPKRLLELLAVVVVISIYLLHLWRTNSGYASDFIIDFGLLGLFGYKVLPALARMVESSIALSNSSKSRASILKNLEPTKALNNQCINEKLQQISLNSISLSFDNKKILHGLNFEIKAGEIIGIMGPSGSGKSSFTKVLLGLLKPHSGSFFVNNTLFDVYLNQSWQKKFGYIGETCLMLDSNVYNNVAFNTEGKIDIEKIETVLKSCELGEFIGANPNVGDMGSNLS
ncbi:MAG: ATP-binding cassette domain-containing protein, partial [Bacteroidia bacterium]